MPGIFLAAPSAPAGPPPAPLLLPDGFDLFWDGWDGTRWELSSLERSAVSLQAGVRGLSMPPVDRYVSAGPAVAGSRWRGHRASERDVFWPLSVYAGLGQAWFDYDAAFWATMRPDKVGTWEVVQPNGTVRTLALRFVDDGAHTFDTDPGVLGWTTYGLTLVAEQPFWAGQPVKRTFAAPSPVQMFAGPGVINISSGHTLASATIPNLGEVDAWPVHTAHGPATSVEVGVGDAVVEIPFSIADGDWVRVDTAPTAQTAVDSTGADRTAELGEVGFAPVPPGTSVPLTLALVGAGRVDVDLVPLFHRAW